MLTLLKQLLKIKGKELFDIYTLPNGSKFYVPKGENIVSTTKNISVKIKENK